MLQSLLSLTRQHCCALRLPPPIPAGRRPPGPTLFCFKKGRAWEGLPPKRVRAAARSRSDHRRTQSALLAIVGLIVTLGPVVAAEPVSDHPFAWVSPPKSPAPPAPVRLTLKTGTWPDSAKPAKPEACFEINQVTVSEITLVDQAEIATAIRPFAGPCQGNTLVKGLMLAINGVYAKHGYVTTQAYLPKQDLKTARKLEIVIKVGRVGEVRYEETPAWTQGDYFSRIGSGVQTVFAAKDLEAFFTALEHLSNTLDDPLERPLIANPAARLVPATVIHPGDPLQIDAMQQGLDSMNKVASSRAQAKLEPGPDPSTSVVVIKNAPEDAFRVTTGYDTYGTRATGIQRGRIEIARDNLIGINDGWRAGLTSSQNLNEITGGFFIPVQWFTLTVDGRYSETLAPIGGFAELFSQNANVSVAGVTTIERTPEGRLDVLLGVRASGNDRTVDDVPLTPQRFFALQAGFTKTWTLGKTALVTLGSTYSHGLKTSFTTVDPANANSTTPRAQFQKVESNVALNWAPIDGVTVSSSLQTQWGDSPFYQVDQLTLGSLSSIRGFQEQPFAVDRGAIWRSEVASRLPVDWALKTFDSKGDTWINNRFKGAEGYLFLDSGYGQDLANRTQDAIASAGFGARYRDSRLTLDWSLARPFYEMSKPPPAGISTYLTVGLKVF